MKRIDNTTEMNDIRYNENLKAGGRLRKLRRVALALGLMVSLGAGNAFAQNYYVFYNGTYGYLYNNNSTLSSATAFSPKAIWNASGTLGTTDRTLQSYSDNSKYLVGSNGRNDDNKSVSIGNSTDVWQSRDNKLCTYFPGSIIPLRAAKTFNLGTSNGTSFTTGTSTSNNFTPAAITINNFSANNPTFPSISLVSVSSSGIQLSHSNIEGTYNPAYHSASVHNYNNNNSTTYYWADGAATATTSAPTVSDWSGAVYQWSIQSGTATINQSGLITSYSAGTIVAKLTTSNISPLANQETIITITVENVNPASETVVGTPTINPTSKTLDYNGSQSFTASATATTTSYAQGVKITVSGNSYWKYNNTIYNSEATYKDAAKSSSPESVTYTWSITGTGASYLSKSDNGASTSVTANNTTHDQQTATLTARATAAGQYKEVSAAITINGKPYDNPTGLTVSPSSMTLSPGDTEDITHTLTPNDAYDNVTYTSSNSSVATVNAQGKVTAVAAGNATITVQAKNQDNSNGPSGTVAVTVINSENAGYVFTYQNQHFLGGTSNNDITTFNPGTCLWTFSSNKWQNSAGWYLNLGNGSPQAASTSNSFANTGSETGTTGAKVYRTNNNTYYLRYNSGWTRTSNSNDSGTGVVFAVKKFTYGSTETAPTISGDEQISVLGSNTSFTKTNASYVAGYFDYVFYDGAHHYCLTETSDATSTEPSVESRTAAFTYTWSLEGIDPMYAEINPSTGAINYKVMPDNDVVATVKLTATSSLKNFAAVSQQVTFVANTTDPTSITASPITVYVGKTGNVIYNLSAAGTTPIYNYVQATSADESKFTVSSANPHRMGTVTVTGVAVGSANLTLQAKKKPGTTNACNTTVQITVKDVTATPVISFEPLGDGNTATATITCATAGSTIYYTTDGTTPTNASTEYSAGFEVNDGDVVKAIAIVAGNASYDDSEVASSTYSKQLVATPEININGNNVTFSCSDEPGVTYYYTTNGSTPSSSNGTAWTSSSAAITNVPNEATIKVIATKAGYSPSEVAQRQFIKASGVSEGVVTLNDLEDHTWTYYAGVSSDIDDGNYNTNYAGLMYSPNPRNVKITYKGVDRSGNLGSNVAISGLEGESENVIVYYKTLEKTVLGMSGDYPYTVISNPFSKRPKSGSTYYGFAGWKLVSGGDYISEHSNNDVLDLDETIHFANLDNNYTANCISAEIVFEATWTTATVKTGTSVQTFTGGTYETNFWVIDGNCTGGTVNSPCTVTMMTPDGGATNNYRSSATLSGVITPGTDNVKVEFVRMNTTNATSAVGFDYTIGRGVISTANNTNTGGQLSGSNSDKDCVNVVKIESGKFSSLRNFAAGLSSSKECDQLMILGCDYDRAKNDNTKLSISGDMYVGSSVQLNRASGSLYVRGIIKSGNFISGVTVAGNNNYTGSGGDQSYYFSVANTHNSGRRYLVVEGGRLAGIAMGMDETNGQSTTGRSADLRVRGTAQIDGVVFGAAEYANAKGTRALVFTGGTVNGWIAGGANGTQSTNGALNGAAYVYVGGTTQVKSNTNYPNQVMNRGIGGNVFGAGCGNSANSSSGQVQRGTHVVLADEAYVERGVYGGGSYGYCTNTQTATMYATGGHVGGVNGGVNGTSYSASITGGFFGGACQNQGGAVKIYMNGGLIEGGLYGGSNSTGTLSLGVEMHINGGQVGASTSSTANIHGGGYGQSTIVTQNVDITLGYSNQPVGTGVTVFGDVYGGSALGRVNGTAGTNTYHTNVTMNAGTINGSIYGGALGSNDVAANVYGPVAVKVYGGSVKQTTADGSGGVYGANNINGAPQRSVTVDIYGTDPAPAEDQYALYAVYGGGNQADYSYSGYPTVTVHNCDNSIEYVYGGGNAAAVSATNVTIYGGDIIGNVFGGGNGTNGAADVNGNADTKIYGGTILNVFGGSNSAGNITGTISVTANETAEGGHVQCPINVTSLYGGGNLAASNAGSINIGCATNITKVFGGANAAAISGNVTLNITAGHIGTVYGGNNSDESVTGNVVINIDDNGESCGMVVGSVFGGGYGQQTGVTGNVDVNIKKGSVTGDVYGGSALGSVNTSTSNHTYVTLTGGTVGGNVYGGGLGAAGIAAAVNGNVKVTLGSNGGSTSTAIGGTIYGCNNVNGTPKGSVEVHIYKTTPRVGQATGEYDLPGVYGGGNQAAYDPEPGMGTSSTKTTLVHIYGCNNSIKDVYGGGNAASTPANHVIIEGGKIDYVFGGGNGYGAGNPGANVGYYTDTDNNGTPGNEYGSGVARTEVLGGTINHVFGGSNTKGNIRETAVSVFEATGCTFEIGEVYGAGNEAYMDGAIDMQLGCIPGFEVLYGGAKNANVGQDINLTLTSGDFGTVYGGNNLGGSINGSITVTLDEIGCHDLTVETLYGGGNMADYTAPTTGAYAGKHYPEINVISATSVGTIFGGGKGTTDSSSEYYGHGWIQGDPTINVNMIKGYPDDGEKAAIGTIGTIFGGGNAAEVRGNTYVNIATAAALSAHTDGVKTTSSTVNGANITGDVFGGGNQAGVTGKTNVVIGKQK